MWEAWKNCIKRAERRAGLKRALCVSRRNRDVGLWTEMSPSSQNGKERLEVSRNRAVFYERKGEGIIWQ